MPVGMFGHGEKVTLYRRTPATNSSGDRVYDDYGILTYRDKAVELLSVAIYPESTSEVGQGNERTNTVYVMVVPATVEIDASDYVRWRDKAYEIQGEAERYSSPMTGTAHQVVRIARVEG